jgi:hypothetical protein
MKEEKDKYKQMSNQSGKDHVCLKLLCAHFGWKEIEISGHPFVLPPNCENWSKIIWIKEKRYHEEKRSYELWCYQNQEGKFHGHQWGLRTSFWNALQEASNIAQEENAALSIGNFDWTNQPTTFAPTPTPTTPPPQK